MAIGENGPDPGRGGEFTYPGTWIEYLRQALATTGLLAGSLAVLLAAVVAVDRYVLERTSIGAANILMLIAVVAIYALISLLMARSLARFRVQVTEEGIAVRRGGSDLFVPGGDVRAVSRTRIPGWWPLRSDLKPRGQTARHMIRISRSSGPPVTFMGGLDREEELVGMIEELITKD
ncbi:MAG: hypothetical protein JSV26_05995 [bacterium]|nr:MAG: hypothetical protein JSV26_05995 [bacterium]